MQVAFISHPDFMLHDMGAGHPECPQRLQAIDERLNALGLSGKLLPLQATEVTHEQLRRVHSSEHIEFIRRRAPAQGLASVDPDTSMCPHSLSAALHAAGALVLATDTVMQGEVRRAFCAVRPPGHHATHRASMGFCLFNNVAVGAAHALVQHGLQRVAIVDFDVHHGNGTQDIFAGSEQVLFCSTHQHPHYPYTGDISELENIVNTPLRAGSGSREFRAAVERDWLPALRSFAPELLFISAGFDAHMDDPLASLNFTDDDYAWVTRQLVTVANTHCEGRIVSTLEGGYALSALGRATAAHIQALME